MLLEGLFIPLTSPLHADGRVNLPKLAANIARYSKTPAAGFILLGPSGEPTLLSDEETCEVLRAAALASTPEKVLIAGIARDSVRSTLALAEFAWQHNYDAVLVGVPSVLASEMKRPALELLTYFQAVADRSSLPLVLMSTRDRPISLNAIVELAAHPNVLGLLDSSAIDIPAAIQSTVSFRREVTVTSVFAAATRRMQHAAAKANANLLSADTLSGVTTMVAESARPASRTRVKTVGFQIISGSTSVMLDALRTGASAIAPPFAACAPQACYEVFAAWKDSDQPLAEEKQLRLEAAAGLAENGPGTLKFGCDLNGYFGGLPRLPHLPPAGRERDALAQLMDGMRN